MKILIIGQAPPAVKQTYPYDTTMLYDWLNECGIDKITAQDIFEFEALSDEFPGFDQYGGHLKPTYEAIKKHWAETLELKVQMANKVLLLGNMARDFYNSQPRSWSCNTQELFLMHPSKRNINLYFKNKDKIISELKQFLTP